MILKKHTPLARTYDVVVYRSAGLVAVAAGTRRSRPTGVQGKSVVVVGGGGGGGGSGGGGGGVSADIARGGGDETRA